MQLLEKFDGDALAGELMQAGVPAAPILSVEAALDHPHTHSREMIVNLPGGYTGIASPIKLSRTPATYRLPPPDANQASPASATTDPQSGRMES